MPPLAHRPLARSPRVLGFLLALGLVLSAALVGCGSSDEQREGSAGPAVTAPECAPAPKNAGGECLENAESKAMLDEYIAECAFTADAVTTAWTQQYGWIWWNPVVETSTSAVGVDLATGDIVCT